METTKRKIYLYISDIASFVGQNKWDCVTPFERLWKRCDTSYDNILTEVKHETDNINLEINKLELEKNNLTDDLENKKITRKLRFEIINFLRCVDINKYF